MELKRWKSGAGETLEWTDYMSLTFTQHVRIIEIQLIIVRYSDPKLNEIIAIAAKLREIEISSYKSY